MPPKSPGETVALIAEPLTPAPLKALGDAIKAFRSHRVAAWWQQFVGREVVDPHEVEDEIMAAAASGDEKTVVAIMEGATAAAAAVESAVLPAIALVGRSYKQGEVPAWFQRGLLSLLSSVSAPDYGQLRDLVHAIDRKMRESVGRVRRITIINDGFETRIHLDVKSDETVGAVRRLDGAMHLFRELVRANLSHESSREASPDSIAMEPRVVAWLAATIPQSRDGNQLEYPPGVG